MTNDDAKKLALHNFVQALEAFSEDVDPATSRLLFLMLWEEHGPIIQQQAEAEGYENVGEWADDEILEAERSHVLDTCGPGVRTLTDDEAAAFNQERNATDYLH
jgi:hypothetical protein